jgi:hypothetical protein
VFVQFPLVVELQVPDAACAEEDSATPLASTESRRHEALEKDQRWEGGVFFMGVRCGKSWRI